jgi:hypothetical protein
MSYPQRSDDPSRAQEEFQDEHDELDDNNNSLWLLYEEVVKSRDKVRIEALKDDMDGILIFVCACYLPLVVCCVYFLY